MKFLLLFLFLSIPALALTPEEHLADEAQEQRAMKLFLQVRCLVCQGQVIESSNTEFSFEMRKMIRKKIAAGKSDEEIRAELVKEFGSDILLEPNPKNFSGALLWFIPVVFALISAAFLYRYFKPQKF